jgi:hypothetical protein
MFYKISYYKKNKDVSPFLQFQKVETMEESIEFVKTILKYHTTNGFYVIAAAVCHLPAGTSTEVAIRWPREILEKEERIFNEEKL